MSQSQAQTFAAARASYRSPIIDRLREAGFELRIGRLTLRCARNFGFCWGVDKAVTMVHEAIAANPGRRMWLLSPIIHNPTVNRDLVARGVRFIKDPDGGGGMGLGVYRTGEKAAPAPAGGGTGDPFLRVDPDDVVVIPAFSAEVEDMERLAAIGCTIVDTTCPWVERPHRRTERLISEGFSLVIHGKVGHDETRATCSLIRNREGYYVVVADLPESDLICSVIRGAMPAATLAGKFSGAISPGFDPALHLERVGLINQTTMLASESREIGQRIAAAMRERYGPDQLQHHFRDYDTICSATQENQDAVHELLTSSGLDLMVVVGGYESSNTRNLARVAAGRVPTYHLEDASAISADAIVHQLLDRPERVVTRGWLPAGKVVVGFTAGASTPDNKLGEVILRLVEVAGERADPLLAAG
jgi:4-hydroxy-3-methylbut-2-enyl diphosphate reductase